MSTIICVLISFSSGVLVAAGTFAVIPASGIVPRMAQRTHTIPYIRLYEDVILLGGLFGCATMFLDVRIPLGDILTMCYGLFCGIFVGVLAVALAEVLNVMPILMRRMKLKQGITWFLLSFALGKILGALLYFLKEGFYIL